VQRSVGMLLAVGDVSRFAIHVVRLAVGLDEYSAQIGSHHLLPHDWIVDSACPACHNPLRDFLVDCVSSIQARPGHGRMGYRIVMTSCATLDAKD